MRGRRRPAAILAAGPVILPLPDEEYGALVGTSTGASGAVKFTLADLGTLRADTVWTRPGGYLDGVVSMADFRQRSDADCAG